MSVLVYELWLWVAELCDRAQCKIVIVLALRILTSPNSRKCTAGSLSGAPGPSDVHSITPSKRQGVHQPQAPSGTCGTIGDLCNLPHYVLIHKFTRSVASASWRKCRAQCSTVDCDLRTESVHKEPGDRSPRPASNRGLPALLPASIIGRGIGRSRRHALHDVLHGRDAMTRPGCFRVIMFTCQ